MYLNNEGEPSQMEKVLLLFSKVMLIINPVNKIRYIAN